VAAMHAASKHSYGRPRIVRSLRERGLTLPRFHVHQIFDSFLMDGGNNGKERSGSESAVHRGVQN